MLVDLCQKLPLSFYRNAAPGQSFDAKNVERREKVSLERLPHERRSARNASSRIAQERVWIAVIALPVFFRISDGPDRKVQMAIARARVAGITDVADDIALARIITRGNVVGVAVKMRVIKDQLLIIAHLVDRVAPGFVLGKPDELAVGGRQHRSSARRDDVYCAVKSSARTNRVERIAQIVWAHALDGNNQNNRIVVSRRGRRRRRRRGRRRGCGRHFGLFGWILWRRWQFSGKI